ncbi:MAG TPA: type II toxin-antitoxin system RelE/ParE family toxin [Longimicrobiaceae bacterium]|nr:type II toxin-antitoxin system RelE/ParE family toxin [Longimicrobiaceae bacterium]
MIFVESRAFSRRRAEHLDEEDFRALQSALVRNPHAGDQIPGTGGLRKLRWAGVGRGKRGGVRIIYYPLLSRNMIFLLLLYAKNEQENLTPEQKRILQALVEAEIAAQAGEL